MISSTLSTSKLSKRIIGQSYQLITYCNYIINTINQNYSAINYSANLRISLLNSITLMSEIIGLQPKAFAKFGYWILEFIWNL